VSSHHSAAFGCSAHSGWAAVVAVGREAGRLRVLSRDRIVIADPNDPPSKQPYHAVQHLPLERAAKSVSAYSATATVMAVSALRQIAHTISTNGHHAFGIGIIDSAGRKGDALATILSSHALIHTAEGEHFRGAIAAAASQCGLAVVRVARRELEDMASRAIGKPINMIQQTITEMGRSVGSPWAADQKSAALIAWMMLAGASTPER
jgi:hypothetical protein